MCPNLNPFVIMLPIYIYTNLWLCLPMYVTNLWWYIYVYIIQRIRTPCGCCPLQVNTIIIKNYELSLLSVSYIDDTSVLVYGYDDGR